jgi:hypothetical protein
MGRLRCYSSSASVSSSLRRLELVLAAALLVWCQRVATAQQQPARVRVGVILNLTSLAGQRRKVGIEMAVEDYYAARPGSRTRVALSFRDSAGDVVGAASAGKLECSIVPPAASSRAVVSEFRCIHACFD